MGHHFLVTRLCSEKSKTGQTSGTIWVIHFTPRVWATTLWQKEDSACPLESCSAPKTGTWKVVAQRFPSSSAFTTSWFFKGRRDSFRALEALGAPPAPSDQEQREDRAEQSVTRGACCTGLCGEQLCSEAPEAQTPTPNPSAVRKQPQNPRTRSAHRLMAHGCFLLIINWQSSLTAGLPAPAALTNGREGNEDGGEKREETGGKNSQEQHKLIV